MIKERFSYLIITTLSIAVTIGLIASPIARAASTEYTADSKVVTIYDGDSEKTVITKGKLVSDALNDAKIKVGKYDAVSPAANSVINDSVAVVRIDRARPVTVVDNGSVSSRVVTPAVDQGKVANKADSDLKSNDTASTHLVTDFVASGGAGEQMKIKRAIPVTFNIYGQTITLRTQKSTVREMLKEAGINLQESDTASINLDTPITEGMPSFNIWRNGIQTIEATEDVPFDTEVHEDSTKQTGYHEVQTVGQVGKKTVIYQVNMQNGVEVGRNKISEVITVQPVKQVEIKGTKVVLPSGSHTDWMAMAGISESDYGYVEYIVSHEGSWCPYRWQGDSSCINHGSVRDSLGYGMFQATPGRKMSSAGSDWATNPITQIKWANSYAIGRYGSWKAAYDHKASRGWW